MRPPPVGTVVEADTFYFGKFLGVVVEPPFPDLGEPNQCWVEPANSRITGPVLITATSLRPV